jgi:hypothetical protein
MSLGSRPLEQRTTVNVRLTCFGRLVELLIAGQAIRANDRTLDGSLLALLVGVGGAVDNLGHDDSRRPAKRLHELVPLGPERPLLLLHPLALEVERLLLGNLSGREREEGGGVGFPCELALCRVRSAQNGSTSIARRRQLGKGMGKSDVPLSNA